MDSESFESVLEQSRDLMKLFYLVESCFVDLATPLGMSSFVAQNLAIQKPGRLALLMARCSSKFD